MKEELRINNNEKGKFFWKKRVSQDNINSGSEDRKNGGKLGMKVLIVNLFESDPVDFRLIRWQTVSSKGKE